MEKNIFEDVTGIEELIYQLAGAASMAWEPRPTGVFDTKLADQVATDALNRLSQLIGNIK